MSVADDKTYFSGRFYKRPEEMFKKLISAEEASKLCLVSAERLIELAKADIAPSVMIDRGEPLFLKNDICEWVKDHLCRINNGKNLTKPFLVVQEADPVPPPKDVPSSLRSMAEHLRYSRALSEPCVYFLILDGEVVYIGQSINLYSRLSEHLKTKTFDKVFYLPVPKSELLETEGAFIRALKPRLNCSEKGTPLCAAIVPQPELYLRRFGYGEGAKTN